MKRTATFSPLTSFQSKVNDSSAGNPGRKKVVSPSESVIRNLLSYSKALAVLKTTDTGYISLVMN